MFLALILYVGLPALLASVTYVLISLKKSGYFDEVQITLLDEPLILSKNVTIFYKYCLVPNSKSGDVSLVFNDVTDILPSESTKLFGIYYDDNDDESNASQEFKYKQAAVGCIYEVDGQQLFESNYAIQLTRWGFEQMVLPKVDCAVHSRQRSNGYFSNLHLVHHTRKQMQNFLKKNNLKAQLSVEVYDQKSNGDKFLDVFKPLDHVDEFFVPEYLTNDQLELRLKEKKLASEGSTETETESEVESASQLEDEEEDVDYIKKA